MSEEVKSIDDHYAYLNNVNKFLRGDRSPELIKAIRYHCEKYNLDETKANPVFSKVIKACSRKTEDIEHAERLKEKYVTVRRPREKGL